MNKSKYLFIDFCLATHQQFSTQKNEESNDSSLNRQSSSNGDVADKNSLLLEFDPEAPSPKNSTNAETPSPNDPFKQFANISSQQDNKNESLLDFEGPSDNTNTNANVPSTPQSNQQEQQLLNQVFDDFGNAAQALETKIDLVSSPPPPPTSDRQPPPSFDTEQQSVPSTESKIEENQTPTSPKLDSTLPTASPEKKPTASTKQPTSASKMKPSSATATTSKSTEHKPAAATSKSTEHKPAATSKITEPKPATAASKSTENKPAASATKTTESKTSTATTRKTLHATSTASAATSNKSKPTPTSPTPESSTAPKPTVYIIINLKVLKTEFLSFS